VRPNVSLGPRDEFRRPDVRAALLVSILSVGWTVTSSVSAIAIGITSHTAVLMAFGAVGAVDAIGSVALVYLFHHSLKHDRLSVHLEAVAHRVVLVGLFVVGCAAVVGGAVRLASSTSSHPSDAGVVLAALSLVVLLALSARKRQVARRIGSDALRSDAHLSAVGAMLAAITLAGTGAARAFGWRWVDPVATIGIGVAATWLAIATWRTERTRS
jgi:divalent metal cation (Fe/Co/Zn/Cd) transporter